MSYAESSASSNPNSSSRSERGVCRSRSNASRPAPTTSTPNTTPSGAVAGTADGTAPTSAEGGCATLNRVSPSSVYSRPLNVVSTTPTPGFKAGATHSTLVAVAADADTATVPKRHPAPAPPRKGVGDATVTRTVVPAPPAAGDANHDFGSATGPLVSPRGRVARASDEDEPRGHEEQPRPSARRSVAAPAARIGGVSKTASALDTPQTREPRAASAADATGSSDANTPRSAPPRRSRPRRNTSAPPVLSVSVGPTTD